MSSESYQWFALAALLIIGWLTEKLLPGMQRRLGVDPAAFDVEKVKAALMSN